MSTANDVLERPDVDVEEKTTDEAPKYFHYVKKDKIVELSLIHISGAHET